MSSLLAPFDDETQDLLNEWDQACQSQQRIMEAEMKTASLAGEDYQMGIEEMVWWKGIRAYGILMNRAIDAGWVKGVAVGEIDE